MATNLFFLIQITLVTWSREPNQRVEGSLLIGKIYGSWKTVELVNDLNFL
jgi:hypothetical protein